MGEVWVMLRWFLDDVWYNFALFCTVWQCLAMFGTVWHCLAIIVTVWDKNKVLGLDTEQNHTIIITESYQNHPNTIPKPYKNHTKLIRPDVDNDELDKSSGYLTLGSLLGSLWEHFRIT